MTFPQIIQGGMGIGVSDWRLARSVSQQQQLGVVSGTAIDSVLVRRLQLGDLEGHVRRAMDAFPDQSVSQRVLERYYIAGGKAADQPFASKPMVGHQRNQLVDDLLMLANFVEVFLAKEGHDGVVGINFLHKIQAPLLPSLYGAILANVDVIIVGAGIPLDIPNLLDRLIKNEKVEQKLHVAEAEKDSVHMVSFDPQAALITPPTSLRRPQFFPVVSSVTLAAVMVKKSKGGVEGLIIEGPSAGGHNAPPRGKIELSETGEPIYGKRDEVDLPAIKKLGLPFWLAGSYGTPQNVKEALAAGAAGVQVGTLFAFCEQSGLTDEIRVEFISACREGGARIKTEPDASPTRFPFKLLAMEGSLSEVEVYEDRCRQCDLGYLREAYEKADGTIGWRCLAEDPDAYARKGGKREDTAGRRCLCNGLMANIGLAQIREDNKPELPLVTCGDDLTGITEILGSDKKAYSSSDVIDYLLGDCAG